MNSKKTVYEKIYTRDTSAIIQQAWHTALMEFVETHEWICYEPHSVLHYMHDGTIEIWENLKFTEWLKLQIHEANKRNPSSFENEMRIYGEVLAELRLFWEKGVVDTIEELERALELMRRGMMGFIRMYYTAMDENCSKEVLEKALRLRDQDVFFDQTDRLIRNSLVELYPEYIGLERTILQDEIKKPPIRSILEDRKAHFVFIGEQYAEAITFEQYQEQQSEVTFVHDKINTDTDTLKGSTVQSGVVRGVVRILKRKEQISELQEGEILVSPMTTPDFLPAMKSAVAIITDEGGITCHAAIVSRELKKPCIIGTKIATQVLKDGMEVEVDADKGIVRKLG